VLSLITVAAVAIGPETHRSDIAAEHPDEIVPRVSG